MKFGAVPLNAAEGAILAHSQQVCAGRLRKGVRLTRENIAELAEAGLREVVVAQLSADDLHEDAAAAELAAALVPDAARANIEVTAPFTGRVNFFAASSGVVVLDAEALQKLNQINPMITLASVPQHQQMAKGGMIATVKIIAYGVPETDVHAACEVARDSVRLATAKQQTASLIISTNAASAGEKGAEAIRARTAALGVDCDETISVAHESGAIGAAITKATGDIVLILTASATSDANDVAPLALRDAGGVLTRFGMPVDPGNLLFIGHHKGRPVIGLPGCARSPALNGADWVLSRVACGIEVDNAMIAAMGVGGLLKEIPTRPQPRRGKRT